MRPNLPFTAFTAARFKTGSILLLAAALVLSARSARCYATDGTWITNANGNWSATANWAGGVIADGTDAIGNFNTIDLTAARTVTIDSVARTLGTLNIGDGTAPFFNYTIAAGAGLSLTLATTTGTPTINVQPNTNVITAPLVAAQGFIKNGPDGSNLQLGASNTSLTGPITVAGGTLRANNANAFNGQTITETNTTALSQVYHNSAGTYAGQYNIIGDGVLEGDAITRLGAIRMAVAGVTLSNTITLLGDSGISARGSGTAGDTISGKITGNFALRLQRTSTTASAGSGTLTLSNAANDWGGNTTLEDGTVKNGASGVIPNGAAAGNLILKNGGTAVIAAIADTLYDLNGFDETVNALISDPTSDNTRLKITNNAATNSTLTVGANNAAGLYRGSIIAGTGAGKLAVVKIGTGTETLAGANSYTGNTTVQAGTLALSSTTAFTNIPGSPIIIVGDTPANSSAVLDVSGITTPGLFHVQTGQTLKGYGTVNGTTTIDSGATLAPGGSIGTTLTFAGGNTTLNGVLKIDLDDSDPSFNDSIKAPTETLDISSATSTVDFDVVGTPSHTAYVFATYGTLVGTSFGNVVDLPSGYQIDYNYQGNNQIALVTVPEPSTMAILITATLGLAPRRRR